MTSIYFQANLWIFSGLALVAGAVMGMGSGGVFRFIPDYFPREVGLVGGLVGVIGGVGGFLLPLLFGYLLQTTGLWTSCWTFLAALAAVCLLWLHRVVRKLAQLPAPATAAPGLAPSTVAECSAGLDMSSRVVTLVLALGLAFAPSLAPRLAALRLPGNHQGFEPAQPIAYSHRLHAGELAIPCQYCHSGAERSRLAGIPSAGVCMNCHRFVTAARSVVRAEEKAAEKELRQPRPWCHPSWRSSTARSLSTTGSGPIRRSPRSRSPGPASTSCPTSWPSTTGPTSPPVSPASDVTARSRPWSASARSRACRWAGASTAIARGFPGRSARSCCAPRSTAALPLLSVLP